MSIEPLVLSSITAAIAVLRTEVLKGIGSEAGKATWTKVKGILGWSDEPHPDLIPQEVSHALERAPELAGPLVEAFKESPSAQVAHLVTNLQVFGGGKVAISGSVGTLNM